MEQLKNLSKDIKLPGPVWAALFVAVTYFAITYMDNPALVLALTVALPAVFKWAFPGTANVESLINIAEILLASQPPATRHIRTADNAKPGTILYVTPDITQADINKHKPNKAIRYFLG